ncbi:homocitrate synthase [Sinanaerobacter chloroacetimidivorans]|jgi:homocitrate synthase NifV|uniref:Homocitrate synthase n=1 Tax=Sinanaerobacter chloroacetimidivorans TaxID=2818044 RepID=A0A8J8B1H2_9FIRM|nr:homocitrate synthase [Sinanaerobacter chloroacetimidivorans]MBR0597727.1 homocitrate synthase [Sinanaerobacter chloroacetimidivorans]
MEKKSNRYLTDTTLRDGEQSPGVSLDRNRKKKLAVLLDQMGFYQIEAGIPAMGSFEKDVICEIMALRKKAKIAVWNRMNIEDIKHSFDCHPDIIHISIPVSDIMISTMLGQNRSWVANTMEACVAYAKEKEYEVSVGFQDASRANLPFMISLADSLSRLEISSIRLADTVGVLTPSRARHLIKSLKDHTEILLGIHTHNDLGMAEAIALEAAKAGAELIDTTLLGVGERAGNCDSFIFSKAADSLFDLHPPYPALLRKKIELKNLL